MRRFIHLSALVVVFAWPFSTLAITQITSVSSSDSGGMAAGNGQTVVSGDSSASASVTTNISDGSADVTVTTERNGQTQTEHRHYDVPSGQEVRVDVATSTGDSRIDTQAVRRAGSTGVSVHANAQNKTVANTRNVSIHVESATPWGGETTVTPASTTNFRVSVEPTSSAPFLSVMNNVFESTMQFVTHFFSSLWL